MTQASCQGYSPIMMAEMERENKRLLEVENVEIFDRHQAKWRYVNQEQLD